MEWSISIKFILSNVLFKFNVFRLIFFFHLDDIFIEVTRGLKSPTIIVLLSNSPFKTINTCFYILVLFCSVQLICSVVSNFLWPHGLQHARLPYPSPTSGVYSNACPLSLWCHPTISSSVITFSSHLSEHQGLFQWVSSSHQVAKVLEFQL